MINLTKDREAQIIKDWAHFAKNNFKKENLTPTLHEYFVDSCKFEGHIDLNNLDLFYWWYFNRKQNIVHFFRDLKDSYGNSNFKSLNEKIIEAAQPFISGVGIVTLPLCIVKFTTPKQYIDLIAGDYIHSNDWHLNIKDGGITFRKRDDKDKNLVPLSRILLATPKESSNNDIIFQIIYYENEYLVECSEDQIFQERNKTTYGINPLSRYSESVFEDTQFLTAKEKFLILKNWETFVGGGWKEKNFTKRLYEHLHLHSGFIAHFNRRGFYNTYFTSKKNILTFFGRFLSSYTLKDYKLLNNAMLEIATYYYPELVPPPNQESE